MPVWVVVLLVAVLVVAVATCVLAAITLVRDWPLDDSGAE